VNINEIESISQSNIQVFRNEKNEIGFQWNIQVNVNEENDSISQSSNYLVHLQRIFSNPLLLFKMLTK